MKFTGLYGIRDFIEGDKAFIMASFLKSLYFGDSWFSKIPEEIFFNNYKKVIEHLLSSGKTTVKIACLPEDNSVIIGYSILSIDYQHIVWVYVKKVWRGKGIGKSLVPQYPQSVTHLSKQGEELMHKFPGVVFNPFAVV